MPASYNVHLVVPTTRAERLAAFFTAWAEKDVWAKIHIVFDGPRPDPITTLTNRYDARGTPVATYAWEDIDALTAPAREIFSRRDSAIRCFGFLQAYRNGADYIITLDDDCLPAPDATPFDFMYSHLTAMNGTRRWASTVPGEHVRGLPYYGKGMTPADVNMGLWTGDADLAAPEQIVREQRGESLSVPLPAGRRMMPAGQYAPLCGMNLAFTRRALPFMFFPPMGEGQPYSRFDDIWCGLVAQKVMAHLGWNWTCGEPFVRHRRLSNAVDNLLKEAPGIGANEWFWDVVDGIKLTATTAELAVAQVGHGLARSDEVARDPYLRRWGHALLGWGRLLAG